MVTLRFTLLLVECRFILPLKIPDFKEFHSLILWLEEQLILIKEMSVSDILKIIPAHPNPQTVNTSRIDS